MIAAVRIIGGSAGGRYIKTPPGRDTRPTASMVRESLFNMLADNIEGAYVIDLFSGSGAIGLEALSRGAAAAVFVDSDKRCCDVIRQNIGSLGLGNESYALVIKCDVMNTTVWERAATELFGGNTATLVMADPPYGYARIAELPGIIAGSPAVSGSATLVIEHSAHSEMPDKADGFIQIRQKKYGDTAITFYAATD